jgi:hypothetical protein
MVSLPESVMVSVCWLLTEPVADSDRLKVARLKLALPNAPWAAMVKLPVPISRTVSREVVVTVPLPVKVPPVPNKPVSLAWPLSLRTSVRLSLLVAVRL